MDIIKRILLVAGFLIALIFSSAAQSVIPKFETIGVNEGLSQSSVYSIYQDKTGYMWFGTADGLNRYDGEKVAVYKDIQNNSISSSNSSFIMGNLCEDKKGNIWYSNGTCIFCYNRFKDKIEKKASLPGRLTNESVFSAVFIDDNDSLWLYNNAEGFCSFNIYTNGQTFYPVKFPQRSDYILTNVFSIIGKDILFSPDTKKGLYKFNIITHASSIFQERKEYRNAIESGGKIYAYSATAIDIYDSLMHFQKTIYPFENLKLEDHPDINSIWEDNYHRLWISTFGVGLVCYEENENKFYYYLHQSSDPNSLPIDIGTVLYTDKTDNLWIGTDGAGVCRIDLKPPKFNIFPLYRGEFPQLKNYFIKCFYEDENKNIWFGTHNSGLNIFNPQTKTLRTFLPGKPGSHELPSNVIGDILKDDKGRIWVGCSMGIGTFDANTGRFDKIKLPASIELIYQGIFVYKLIKLSNHAIAAATASGILFIKDTNAGKATVVYNENNNKDFLVTDIDETAPSELWYTSPENGLFHAHLNPDFSVTISEKYFDKIDLRCIHPDEENKNIIWIGAGIGLIRFNIQTKQYKLFDNMSGMNNSYVYGVLEDNNHHLWISTNGGISIFDKQTEVFTNYTKDDGLQSNEFNTGAYYKGNSGNLYFGGIKGFNWFDPAEIKIKNNNRPSIAIAYASVNQNKLLTDSCFQKDSSIYLGYNENNIAFTIASLDFTLSKANVIQYKLDGWDKNWITTKLKTIRYTQLSPGKYIFRVKTANSDKVWSDEKHFRIIIEAPFWKTWWFYTLIALLVIAILIVVTRYVSYNNLKEKIRELEKQKALEEERKRISREMHDDIGAGLTQITLMSEAAKRKGPKQRELDEIARTSRHLVGNMSEIIWSLNAENNTLEQLMAYVRESLYKLLEVSRMNYSIQLPENGKHITLDNEQRRNILLVTKEIVHNSIKHSKGSEIWIKGVLNNNILEIEIKDNGCGFDTSIIFSGNGMRNIEHRIKEINGILKISSTPGAGSIFFFSIPLNSHS